MTHDQQRSLFPDSFIGLPYQPGSTTSQIAAASMIPHAGHQRARVLRHYQLCGAYGATCDEVEIALGMLHGSAATRIQELREQGWLDPAETRPTRSNRPARVYVARETPKPEGVIPRQAKYKQACLRSLRALDGGDTDFQSALPCSVKCAHMQSALKEARDILADALRG